MNASLVVANEGNIYCQMKRSPGNQFKYVLSACYIHPEERPETGKTGT